MDPETELKFNSFIEKAHNSLLKNKKTIQYLRSRGISNQQIKKYKIGCSTERSGVKLFDQWSWDGKRLKNRVLFPIKNSIGKYKGIGSRLINQKKGKYLYYYFNRTDANFFGFENLKSIWEKGYCYISEGVFDHFVLEQVYDNCLCSLSAGLRAEHIKLLRRFVGSVILAFDADPSGANKMNELALEERLNDITFFQIIGIRDWSNDSNIKDLNGLWKKLGIEKFKQFLEEKSKLFLI